RAAHFSLLKDGSNFIIQRARNSRRVKTARANLPPFPLPRVLCSLFRVQVAGLFQTGQCSVVTRKCSEANSLGRRGVQKKQSTDPCCTLLLRQALAIVLSRVCALRIRAKFAECLRRAAVESRTLRAENRQTSCIRRKSLLRGCRR